MIEPWRTLLIVGLSIAAVIVLVLRVRLPAFLALLVVALATGLAFGGEPARVLAAVRKGSGEALGFVAVVIGLGAMLGGLLEASGGVATIANRLLDRFGERRAPWALTVIGVLVGIPLFFDVAFIILVPLLATLSQRAGRRVIYFALPVLAGLMAMHALLPPHPGPVAVAELLGADYGLLAIYGLVCGIPAAVLAGPVFARFAHGAPGFGDHAPPSVENTGGVRLSPIGFGWAMIGMLVPLVLIVVAAVAGFVLPDGPARAAIGFVGHPFVALVIACLLVAAVLVRAGTPMALASDVMTRALAPAGLMVLVVGAGAAYKEVLIESGAGQQIADVVAAAQLPVLVFAFLIAGFVRLAQGSATVAMVTAAGLCAPIVTLAALSPGRIALVTIAIGGGATIASHVNDTGFWLVKQYLGLSEAQTFRSWTIASTIAGVAIFAAAAALWSFV